MGLMRVEYDSEKNALRLMPDGESAVVIVRRVEARGVIDVAGGGRLAGIELSGLRAEQLLGWKGSETDVEGGTAYFAISEGDDHNTRSVGVVVALELVANDALLAIVIPRRGEGYEISYPSGNQ